MTVWTRLGNVRKLTLKPAPEVKEHKNFEGGAVFIDKVKITLKKIEFSLQADEWTPDTATLSLLGLQKTDTAGPFIEIMGAAAVERQLKFTGANDDGPQVEVILPRVFMMCKDDIDLISEDDSILTITGQILKVGLTETGSFGTWRFLSTAHGGAPITSPSVLNYYTAGTGSVFIAPVA